MSGSARASFSAPPDPVELLQELIRFDTGNPPGNEAACVHYVNHLLTAAGFETQILARSDARPNVVTRLPGRGDAPPLFLHGHLDVVTARHQAWTYPPFAGTVADGYVWGRGALDMKGPVAVMLTALLRARAEGRVPPGDVVLALVSDEEAGCAYGSRYLVEEHAGLFTGIRYAIGEGGGYTYHLAGRRFYPIMIAEKQSCWMTATVRGNGGHAAVPVRGQAMARTARLLAHLDRRRLPVHITPAARAMIEALASALPWPQGTLLRLLLRPRLTDRILRLLGPLGTNLDPLLHNSVSATQLRGSDKVNVIPSEVQVGLDARLLPGYTPDDLLDELCDLLGDGIEYTIDGYYPSPARLDMGLLSLLAEILETRDPGAAAGPVLVAGTTDALHYARLGIQCYGWTPLVMPSGFDYYRLGHAADERIPIDAVHFGIEAFTELLQRFGEAG